MLLILLFILLIVLLIGGYFILKLTKWILKNPNRIKRASVFIGVIILVFFVNHLYFKNMKFLQSKVYPNIYIVKYPIKDIDSLHGIIKKMVLQKLENENRGLPYKIRFYEYYNGTPFFIPFGEAGTAHFIKHKENPGGFSSEELSHYSQYLIAQLNVALCKNDTINYFGNLTYWNNGAKIKTVKLLNQCQKESNQNLSEAVTISRYKYEKQ